MWNIGLTLQHNSDIFNCDAVKVTIIIIIIFYFINFLDMAIMEVIFLASSETNNIMPR